MPRTNQNEAAAPSNVNLSVRRRRPTPAPPMRTLVETNRQRFLRIGQYRIVNALKALRLVGNLAGQGYEYTPDDIALMRNTIGEAVEEAFARFEKSHAAKKLEQSFKLAELVSH